MKWRPRAILVDSDTDVIDDLQVGKWRGQIDPDNCITSTTSAGSNFAMGRYTIGP